LRIGRSWLIAQGQGHTGLGCS